MNNSTTPTTATATIPRTGETIMVSFQDSSRPSESVLVRKVPRHELNSIAVAVMEAKGDEVCEASVYVDRPIEWIQSLSDESFDAVMQEGRRLNWARFSAWFQRASEVVSLAKIQAPLMAGLRQVIDEALQAGASGERTKTVAPGQ